MDTDLVGLIRIPLATFFAMTAVGVANSERPCAIGTGVARRIMLRLDMSFEIATAGKVEIWTNSTFPMIWRELDHVTFYILLRNPLLAFCNNQELKNLNFISFIHAAFFEMHAASISHFEDLATMNTFVAR